MLSGSEVRHRDTLQRVSIRASIVETNNRRFNDFDPLI
jgi:hypothetical protein